MQRTVACRLTPLGEGGIGLIEVSGPRSAEILDRLFANPRGVCVADMTAGRLLYGKLVRRGALLDEAIVECVSGRDPAAFVLNCHGGALAARRVTEALAAEGAHPAGEREFHARRRRAGGLDRIQEEAAERIPFAPTFRAAQTLLDQYDGALSRALTPLRGPDGVPADWTSAAAALRRLLLTAPFGRAIVRPPRLVIAGRPNVGKSTLANALLQEDRMIVHATPGTTRDTVEELLSIGGVPFTLVDTAGLRAARDEIEREGVRRGARELRRADVAILLFDASAPLEKGDLRILAVEAERGRRRPDSAARRLLVLNKCDLPAAVGPEQVLEKAGRRPLLISAATGSGLEELGRRIVAAACPEIPEKGEAVLFTVRQERLVRSALAAALKKDRPGLLARVRELVGEAS